MNTRLPRVLRAAVLICLLALSGACTPTPKGTTPAPANGNTDKQWEVVTAAGGSLAVPKRWRTLDPLPPRTVVFRQGDGIDVPALDETQAPLQIGLTVEKIPNIKQSLKEGVQSLLQIAKQDPQLEMEGKETVESLELSDGTKAMLLTTEFIKEKRRRSLQIKMVAQDEQSNGWVVSGFIVGGKDSKMPAKDSTLARWLRAHITSFCFDGTKLDEDSLKEAYKKRD